MDDATRKVRKSKSGGRRTAKVLEHSSDLSAAEVAAWILDFWIIESTRDGFDDGARSGLQLVGMTTTIA